ncbi:MAG: hypothetical protein ACLT3W_02855 [Bifidobacterium pseudocatenulatum]
MQYRAYCMSRRVTPQMLSDWMDIPPMPVDGFKMLTLRLRCLTDALRGRVHDRAAPRIRRQDAWSATVIPILRCGMNQ